MATELWPTARLDASWPRGLQDGDDVRWASDDQTARSSPDADDVRGWVVPVMAVIAPLVILCWIALGVGLYFQFFGRGERWRRRRTVERHIDQSEYVPMLPQSAPGRAFLRVRSWLGKPRAARDDL